MKIVAIGGGEIGTTNEKPYNLKEIDKEIVKMTGKAHPVLLFLGFNERANYFFGTLKKHYMELGAQCTYLKFTEFSNQKTVESKFKRANIIYINGGNTMIYMREIKKYGLDKYIIEASKRDVVLAGISAGAICYHKLGSSDSRTYKENINKFTKVNGIGIVEALFSPHYSNSKRPLDIQRMTKNLKMVSICADDCTALVIDGEDYKVLKSKTDAKIQKCYTKDNKFICYELKGSGKYLDLISKI